MIKILLKYHANKYFFDEKEEQPFQYAKKNGYFFYK